MLRRTHPAIKFLTPTASGIIPALTLVATYEKQQREMALPSLFEVGVLWKTWTPIREDLIDVEVFQGFGNRSGRSCVRGIRRPDRLDRLFADHHLQLDTEGTRPAGTETLMARTK